MKRTLMTLVLAIMALPSVSFAHDDRRWESYDRRDRYERVARPGDPGYYLSPP